MKGLHNIQPVKASQKRRKRVGRGNSSGTGNYSGRGMKGQRSRSGGKSGLAARSMRAYLLRIPKTRGFSSGRKGYTIITLAQLQALFEDGARIAPKQLRSRGLITAKEPVKILANGELSKKFTVAAHQFSAQAKTAIEKAGGTIEFIIHPKSKSQEKQEQKKKKS